MAKRGKNKEYPVPDFSSVSEGEIWRGRNYRADFIKAIGMKPEPAGKHSRDSQEKWIRLFCEIADDEDAKELCLTKIYDEKLPKPKQSRSKKYFKYIAQLIINRLNRQTDGKLITTRAKLLKDIHAVSQYYRNIPPEYYAELWANWDSTDDSKVKKATKEEYAEASRDLKYFRQIVSDRFRRIIDSVLEEMEKQNAIMYKEYPVIVNASGEHVYLDLTASEPLDDEVAEKINAQLMLLDNAQQWAVKQIEVTQRNDKTGETETRHPENYQEVIKWHKYSEYIEFLNQRIEEEYHWQYTYNALEIVKREGEEIRYISSEEMETAAVLLNKMLCEAARENIEKRHENLQDKYEQKRRDLAFERLEDYSDWLEEYQLGILTDEDVIRGLIRKNEYIGFRYPQTLIYNSKSFIKYELEFIDQAKLTRLESWLKTHKYEEISWKQKNYF